MQSIPVLEFFPDEDVEFDLVVPNVGESRMFESRQSYAGLS